MNLGGLWMRKFLKNMARIDHSLQKFETGCAIHVHRMCL